MTMTATRTGWDVGEAGVVAAVVVGGTATAVDGTGTGDWPHAEQVTRRSVTAATRRGMRRRPATASIVAEGSTVPL
jgi:hypothetical protein